MSSKKYSNCITTLKNELSKIHKKHIGKDSEPIAVLQLTNDEFDDKLLDVKVKGLYSRKDDEVEVIDDRIKNALYKWLKLKEPRECIAINHSAYETISVDEEFTENIVVEEGTGEFGQFGVMCLE